MTIIDPEIRKEINQEFYQSKNEEFRKWYFSKYDDNQLQNFKKEFYNWIEYSKKIIPFTQWFYGKYFTELDKSINVIQDYHRNWKTMTGTVIRAVHPPTIPLELEGNSESDPSLETVAFVYKHRYVFKNL